MYSAIPKEYEDVKKVMGKVSSTLIKMGYVTYYLNKIKKAVSSVQSEHTMRIYVTIYRVRKTQLWRLRMMIMVYL